MKLAFQVDQKPKFGQVIIFALQQLLAILAATIAVPAIVGNGMSASAALFGAGVGTIVYLLFTRFKSPVFLGSSFAFLGSMFAAFAGAASTQVGYAGLIIGAAMAGLVYVIIALVVKVAGVKWIDRLMPAVVIGPTVAIIGLSLAGNAVGDAVGVASEGGAFQMNAHAGICLACALVTLAVVMICSVYGKKMAKMIPFVIGIAAGYAVAAVFTVIGDSIGNEAMQIIDFTKFQSMRWYPEFTFVEAFKGFGSVTGEYILTLFVAYVPVAFVVFAEHIADHKNLSTIIEKDLLRDPGLHRTLVGDGLATAFAGFFGGPANTTYGENTGVLALSKVYDPRVVRLAAIYAIILSFSPKFDALVNSIPAAIVGGVSFILYGMISAVGVRNIVENQVDLTKSRNLIIAAVMFVSGLGFSSVGGITFTVGDAAVTLSGLAIAALCGVILNAILPGNDYVFGVSVEGDKSADLGSY